LSELINVDDPAIPLVREWAANAVRPVEILLPSDARDEVLLKTQVTTRSPLGAIAHETGGLLVDGGWLRIIGSGNRRFTRTLPGWNEGRSHGFYLVADDAAGGFFAMNGGAFGTDTTNLYYFAPDTLKWEAMGMGYSQFLRWVFSKKYDQFCEDLRWPGWESAMAKLSGDQCIMSYPPLWTQEGQSEPVHRAPISVEEAWAWQMDTVRQLRQAR
jgi:hypothetical protein